MPGRGRGSGTPGIVKGTKLKVDPGIREATNEIAHAVQRGDAEAERRAREKLAEAQRAKRIRDARRVLDEERRRVLVAAGFDPDAEDEAL